MKLLRKVWYLTSMTAVLGLLGCTDYPTASVDFFDPAPAPGFGALEWREPLGQEIVVRQMVGPAGGVIELRGTGVVIRFPEGAVSESVLIEARALQGSVVAFEFVVPVLTLGAPIEIRVERERVPGQWVDLFGVYSGGDSPSKGTPPPAGVSGAPGAGPKTFPALSDGSFFGVDLDQDEIKDFLFSIEFFGYAVASG